MTGLGAAGAAAGSPGAQRTSTLSKTSRIFALRMSSTSESTGLSARSPTTFIKMPMTSTAAARTGSKLSPSAGVAASVKTLTSPLAGALVVAARQRASHLSVSVRT